MEKRAVNRKLRVLNDATCLYLVHQRALKMTLSLIFFFLIFFALNTNSCFCVIVTPFVSNLLVTGHPHTETVVNPFFPSAFMYSVLLLLSL